MKNIFQKVKSKIIYLPRLFYSFVYIYAWLIFRKKFSVSFPPKEINQDSTNFLFVLQDKKSGQKYLAKCRNTLSDLYFYVRHKRRNRMSDEKQIELLKRAQDMPNVKSVMPDIRIYKNRVLWEYLEGAKDIGNPVLGLSHEEGRKLIAPVHSAVKELLERGIIYGKVKHKHVLVKKESDKYRVVLIDWDTVRES